MNVPSAASRTGRLIGRHKVISSAIAVFVAAAIAVSLATTSGSAAASPRNDPVAPGFSVAALGKPGKLALSQYKGKPVILNFWASWCDVCQTETPLLAHWYKQHQGHVNLLGLDENDGAGKALAFAHSHGMTYPLGFDPVVAVASEYNVNALPQTFFLNAQHRIVDHVIGALTDAKLNHGLSLMDAGR